MLMAIRPVSYRFKVAVEYQTYLLGNIFLTYDRTVLKNVGEMAKRMTNQIKSYIVDPFDPILILGFLKNFKLAYDTNSIHEGATVWLSYFLMNKSASAVLNAR